MTLSDLFLENWQHACSVILMFALGYAYARRNYLAKLRDQERENDKLRGENVMLYRMLRKREGDNEVPKSEVRL